jgi:hypothetical protein
MQIKGASKEVPPEKAAIKNKPPFSAAITPNSLMFVNSITANLILCVCLHAQKCGNSNAMCLCVWKKEQTSKTMRANFF